MQHLTISRTNAKTFIISFCFLKKKGKHPIVEFQKRNFEIILRKLSETHDFEEYRIVTLNVAVEIDDLLCHPDIFEVIGDRVVRLTKIDQMRWQLKISRAN